MPTWTAACIAEHMPRFLCGTRLILVSNRAPYIHRWHRSAPSAPGGDSPLPARKVDTEGWWVRRFLSQLSRPFQNGHAIRWSRPAGGLTAALDPVMQACHGTWVAWGSGNADRGTVDAQDHRPVPPDNPQYTLRRVWLSEAQVQGFYYGFANSALWPLCHLHLQHAVFNPHHWHHYQEVNAHFAEVVAEECGNTRAMVWSQD